MKRKHEDEHEDEDSTLALIVDIEDWWLDLPRDMQKKRHFWDVRPPLICLDHH